MNKKERRRERWYRREAGRGRRDGDTGRGGREERLRWGFGEAVSYLVRIQGRNVGQIFRHGFSGDGEHISIDDSFGNKVLEYCWGPSNFVKVGHNVFATELIRVWGGGRGRMEGKKVMGRRR
jgi:hypothetical protein